MNQRAKLEHQRILDPIIHALPILLPRDKPGDQLDPATYLAQQAVGEGPIYVLCQAGGRASKAVEKFTQAWIGAGLPVNHGERKVIPLIRQVPITVGAISGIGSVPALMSATPTSSKNSGNYPVP